MINFTRDRPNLLFLIEHNVDRIRIDSDGIEYFIVETEVETTPRQLVQREDLLDMFLAVSNVHAQNCEFRFRMFLNERPPGCVKAFAGSSPVAEKIDQNNFAFELRGGNWLSVDVCPFDGGERRTDFQVALKSDLFWLTTGE